MTEVIGWISSTILFLTVSQQIYKQWHEGTSEGVSRLELVRKVSSRLKALKENTYDSYLHHRNTCFG